MGEYGYYIITGWPLIGGTTVNHTALNSIEYGNGRGSLKI